MNHRNGESSDPERKSWLVTSRITMCSNARGALGATPLLLGIAFSASFAFADDPPDTTTRSVPPVHFVPMSEGERFRRYLRGLNDPESIVRSAAAAGIHQATGEPTEWGGGARGYGLRIGNSYAQHVISRTLQYGVAAVLHEDNRYFVSGRTGFLQMVSYDL
jgi:hypothetical protein